MAKKTAPVIKGSGPIRVKALKTIYYNDGLRMPGSVFDIKGEHEFSAKSMKKVSDAIRKTSTPVSPRVGNQMLPPGPPLTAEEQELADEQRAAEDSESDPGSDETVI